METPLENIIELRSRLHDVTVTLVGFKGEFLSFNKADLDAVLLSRDYITDIYVKSNRNSIDITDGSLFFTENIVIEVRTGNLQYYESFTDFVVGNKLKRPQEDFYIQELSFYCDLNITNVVPVELDSYLSNIKVIEILKIISDFSNTIGNELKLFFYKAENGLELEVKYEKEDLVIMDKAKLAELTNHFNSSSDKEVRIQIFKNELVNILYKEEKSYVNLLRKWELIIDSYTKSFELYLSGFSFEKIKSTSFSYFHEITDKIQQTIGKVSGYIFGVPIAYVLLLRYIDFSGRFLIRDLLLVVIGGLFLILVWFVAFKNISESIDEISNDIDDFKSRMANNNALISIIDKLDGLKEKSLNAQRFKLKIAKIISIAIYIIILGAFISIYYKKISFVFMSMMSILVVFYFRFKYIFFF